MLRGLPGHVVRQGLAGSGVRDRVRGERRDGGLEMIHEVRVVLGRVHGARHECFASARSETDAGRDREGLGVGRGGGRRGERRWGQGTARLLNETSSLSNQPPLAQVQDRPPSRATPQIPPIPLVFVLSHTRTHTAELLKCYPDTRRPPRPPPPRRERHKGPAQRLRDA